LLFVKENHYHFYGLTEKSLLEPKDDVMLVLQSAFLLDLKQSACSPNPARAKKIDRLITKL
jgi:hypothetical protein